LSLLALLLVVISLYSLTSGVISSSFGDVLLVLVNGLGSLFSSTEPGNSDQLSLIVFQIRIPRLLLGILVGSGLAICGTVMQGLFRNPMADPGLLGVSSGAALGAVLIIVLGLSWFGSLLHAIGSWLLPLMAFAGGLTSIVVVYQLSKSNNRTDVPTMLLAGIAVNAIAGAFIGLLSYIADDTQLRDLIFWSLGSLEVTSWWKLAIGMVLTLPAIVCIPFYANALNANLLGENEARHLGIDMENVKKHLIILIALVVGVSVSLSGIIGFVGLVVPHLLRIMIGPDHRLLLPASALFGASLLVAADIIARTIVAPAEIPIGIITAILGGPFFLWLLVRFHKTRQSY
jgi:iron complex transport system permease protein